MINNDRIVPVTKTDLLSLYGTISNIALLTLDAHAPFKPFEAEDVEGNFVISETPQGNLFFNQPVKSLVIGTEVTGFAAVCVFDYHFEGVKDTDGNAIEMDVTTIFRDEAELVKDASTLYALNYSSDDGLSCVKVTP